MRTVTSREIIEWHKAQGGHDARAAGHALRILRECVELCVASGASELEVTRAVSAEIYKASSRGEFEVNHHPSEVVEEFVDVRILMSVFQSYFLNQHDLDTETRCKFEVCQERQWEADADGVLWRPGTRGAGKLPGSAESS